MEKSQHTNFNEDTTNESAGVACSNVRLWKLDTRKEWRNTSWRLWDERAEKDSAGFVYRIRGMLVAQVALCRLFEIKKQQRKQMSGVLTKLE